MQHELAVIGGGNMAEAIVRGALSSGALEPSSVIVSDPDAERLRQFVPLCVDTTNSNADVVASAKQVMLAVKPQVFEKVIGDLAGLDLENQIVISIMAGLTSAKIEKALSGEARIVRVMPNTPLLAGAGMSAIAIGPNAQEGDELLALQVFRAAGEAIVVDESLMDAVTAVSGSGPAYVFYLAEAMNEAARQLGLSDEHAALLTQQTIFGSAKLMTESDDPPAELRRKVTSPGGTTQAACEHLDASDLRKHIVDAIHKACQRSKELGA